MKKIISRSILAVGIVASVITIYQFASSGDNCPLYDLSGNWRLVTIPTDIEPRFSDEFEKTNVFSVVMEQNCNSISGTGVKVEYDGELVSRANRSTLTINSSSLPQNSSAIQMTFVEEWSSGTKSVGNFDLSINPTGDNLSGSFYTAVGSITGFAIFTAF